MLRGDIVRGDSRPARGREAVKYWRWKPLRHCFCLYAKRRRRPAWPAVVALRAETSRAYNHHAIEGVDVSESEQRRGKPVVNASRLPAAI